MPSTFSDVICNSTPYPSSCKSILPHDRNGTMQYYTWISLNQSLSSAQNLLSLVEYHMTLPSTSSLTAIQALKDGYLDRMQADDYLTWISSDDDDGKMEGRWLRERILIRDQQLYEFISREKQVPDDGFVGNDVSVSEVVVVNPDGSGNLTTINDAVAAAPNSTAGSNPAADNYTTFDSATFAVVASGFVAVVASGFVAVNITFRNTAGANSGQAVALRSGADLSAFYNCSFEGYQDTLYTHSLALRQFYRECDIYGTVDFIFGNAAVVLQDCNIYPRLPLYGQFNAITAQGRTDLNQNTGTSIQNCTIRAAEELRKTKTYLGRPWKEYSRTVFMQSFMDSLIDPSGWHEWSGDDYLTTLY
ncbi:hypothetical protein SLEP1_g28866 [Rubroshorea leprosula]|uniref:Pectinesterase n=1 Tax=Rubroshorea leprosula TaxID=152421 RepID=A0AAV5K3P4_9ROSI|nr:hypothetical protein SLEP1_g28866 [Rubroshorea leprosula]